MNGLYVPLVVGASDVGLYHVHEPRAVLASEGIWQPSPLFQPGTRTLLRRPVQFTQSGFINPSCLFESIFLRPFLL